MRLIKFFVIAWGWILYLIVWKPMVAHAKWDNDLYKEESPSQEKIIISEEVE